MSLPGACGEQRGEVAPSVHGILERLDADGRAEPPIDVAFVLSPVNSSTRMPRRPEAEPLWT